MSYSEVYGLKFDYQELKELLRPTYQGRIKKKWKGLEEYLLIYMADELSADVKKEQPEYEIKLFCADPSDKAGNKCVLGIEISCYVFVSIDKSSDEIPIGDGEIHPEEIYYQLESGVFRNTAEYDKNSNDENGSKILALDHMKSPNQPAYDRVIETMKKLIGKHAEGLTAKFYRV